MDKQELLKQFRKKFAEIKKELGFKATLEDIDRVFFIKDYILEKGYVSDKLSRQICRRICETYYSWVERLYSILLPAPGNLLAMTESEYFEEKEKEEISNLIKKTMSLISFNSVVGLTKDKKEEALFIDEAVSFWNKEFKPKLVKIMKKINKKWKE